MQLACQDGKIQGPVAGQAKAQEQEQEQESGPAGVGPFKYTVKIGGEGRPAWADVESTVAYYVSTVRFHRYKCRLRGPWPVAYIASSGGRTKRCQLRSAGSVKSGLVCGNVAQPHRSIIEYRDGHRIFRVYAYAMSGRSCCN